MRILQPVGKNRWIFDSFRDHGLRDGYCCASSTPWVVAYTADHVFRGAELSQGIRMAVDAASTFAINRMRDVTAPSTSAPIPKLSPREKTMLQHLSDGLSASDIADRLELSETTVRTFILRAEKKLGAVNQLHAVSIAIPRGLT